MNYFITLFILFFYSNVYANSSTIIGELDWKTISQLESDNPFKKISKIVGNIDIVSSRNRCSGFLIAENIVMTNYHCVSKAEDVVGLKISFNFEDTVSYEDVVFYDCNDFIGGSRVYDYALIRCSGNPSKGRGQANLEVRPLMMDENIFVIHQNCDYFLDPICKRTKKYSPGKTIDFIAGKYHHSADTLGGSSGSPMFNQDGKVIGLHHAGLQTLWNGRGLYNVAVPMIDIISSIIINFPDIKLNFDNSYFDQLNADIDNDSFDSAREINVDNERIAFLSDESLVDFYKFRIDNRREVNFKINFHYHQIKDIRVVLYNRDGIEIYRTSNYFADASFKKYLDEGYYFLKIYSPAADARYWFNFK